jgi:hypothetical protein
MILKTWPGWTRQTVCVQLMTSIIAGVLILAGPDSNPASAQLSGPSLEVAPYGGAVIWANRARLHDSVIFGGRALLKFHPMIGIEGTYGWSPTRRTWAEPEADIDAHHVGVDLMLTLRPGAEVVPYVLGGWTQFFVSAQEDDPLGLGDGTRDFNGWEFGGGLKVAIAEGSGHRVDLRLEACDAFARFDLPAPLEPESHAVLDDIGEILVKWTQLRIEIGGHTDSRGPAEYNQQLSRERAQSVLDYLRERYPEIDRGQYTVVGYGESEPVASNETAEGRQRNRRVEFKVLNREVLRR